MTPKKKRLNATSIATYGVLLAGVAVTLTLPSRLSIPTVKAYTPPASITLRGVIRDFPSSHPDFDVTPDQGYGHYAGLVVSRLSEDGRPIFVGDGTAVVEDDFSGPVIVPFGNQTFSQVYTHSGSGPGTPMSDAENAQVATQIMIPVNGTVDTITAYVDCSGDETGYALYTDAAGEPGTLLASTSFPAPGSGWQWLTVDLPDTPITADKYWLALAQDSGSERYELGSGPGQTRRNTHDAEENGFQATWSGTVTNRFQPVSIYATLTDGSNHGYTGPTPNVAKEHQIATEVTLPEDCTLKSIAAYVGSAHKDIRYALYDDAAGQPGALIVESEKEQTSDDMQWLELEMPETPLNAGTYWLALAMDHEDQQFGFETTGGTTYYAPHDAADHDFLSNWTGTISTTSEQISIYATYETVAGTFHFVPGGEGGSFKVNTEWYNEHGMPIPPQLHGSDDPTTIDFVVDDQEVVPSEAFAIKATVLGAAIQNGSNGYHLPVTVQLDIGGTTHQPFGPLGNGVTGNVNDDQTVTGDANPGPHSYVFPGLYPAGTEINVTGQSWKMNDADVSGTNPANWHINRMADTFANGPQVKVLRDGDSVPTVPGLYDQDSIADFVSEYVDTNAGIMSLDKNQIICLFELGTTGTSYSADFQDLVLLLELGDSVARLNDPTTDVAGTPGPDSTAGITSAESFDEWFRDVMGTNLSRPHNIRLHDDGTGVFEYVDDAFYPIDRILLGNEGRPHNCFFTYAIDASFVYDEDAGQFFEFQGNDDAWLFIEGRLALDLGGIMPGVAQIVELDRLGLVDGETYSAAFFHARRQCVSATFDLRTNIRFISDTGILTSGISD